ncbi:Stag1, partial [Symbiodinium natans]
ACTIFLPEMPRLMDICRPDEEQFLLLSHLCKILLEYAVENSQSQVLVNAKAMCLALRRAIEDPVPMETMRNCADSLLSLAKNFDEAKTVFLDLSKEVHKICVDLLQDNRRLQELRTALYRFLTLVNRGIDMSFGSTSMLRRQLALLQSRVGWSRERRKLLEQAQRDSVKEEPNTSPRSPRSPLWSPFSPGGETAGPRKRRRLQSRPEDVPDVRLTLLMLESVVASVMWHVRMAFWVETQGVSPEGRKAAELQVAEMLQGFTELPLLRAELPSMMTELRNVCLELVDSDFNSPVQACAFSAYMTLVQNCVGVSDTLSLEVDESGQPAAATGWGGTYKVRVPKDHMQVLFNHLNGLYVSLTDAEIEGVPFSAEGYRLQPKKNSYHPVPNQGTLTSLRHLALQMMQTPGEDPEAGGHLEISKTDLLLFAVLATRQVMECELEDIIAGPMATLVLTQLEKARPKPLKE